MPHCTGALRSVSVMRFKRLNFVQLVTLLLIVGCSSTPTTLLPSQNTGGITANSSNSSRFVNFTKLVNIGHHRALFMHCAGPSSGVRIVFVNGAGDTLEVWSRVQETLSRVALTCSYDP